MKTIYARILLAIVLTLMCVLLSSGYVIRNDSRGNLPGEEQTEQAVLARPFKLKYGQELTVEGQNLKVTFDSMLEDSRCPADVECVWSGDAKISISVRRANSPATKLELHTNGQFPQARKYRQYLIKLAALDPYPKTRVKGNRSDYVATILITKE